MRCLPAAASLLVALAVVAVGSEAPVAQSQRTDDLLQRYAQGDFDVVSRYGTSRSFKVDAIKTDLEKLTPPLFKTNPYRPADARRLIASFVMEVANAGLLSQTAAVNQLLTWTRIQLIDAHNPPDDFDRSWHHLEIALQQLRMDGIAVETAAAAALKQFPTEPRFVLALAWVEERKLAGAIAARTEVSDDRRDGVAVWFGQAMAFPKVKGEAQLRFGRVEWGIKRLASAVEFLNGAVANLGDPSSSYLAHLFRGQALSELGRSQEALASFGKALEIVPGAQSATMALAAQLAIDGARTEAEILVQGLLTKPTPGIDPWWIYPTGDALLGTDLLAKLRLGVR